MDKSQQFWFYIFLSSALALSISIIIQFDVFTSFISLPYITGWDGSSHFGVMEIYSKNIFPSVWGWENNWYAGIPFPIFYPPLVYYFGSIVARITNNTDDFLSAYKISMHLIMFLNVLITTIFTSLILKRKRLSEIILIGIVVGVFLGINTGSPSSFSLYLAASISQNLSMLWLLPALYCVLNKNKFNFFIGAILCSLLQLSNAHTSLTFGLICFFIIFIFTDSIEGKKETWYKKVFNNVFYVGSIQTIGLMIASFWIIPMLQNYSYFTGISIATDTSIDFFFKKSWIILLLALGAIYVSWRKNDKKIFKLSAIFTLCLLFIFTIQIYQSETHRTFFLPIHITRWYETMFYLLIIPFAYTLIESWNRKKFFGIGILSILLILVCNTVFNLKLFPRFYPEYASRMYPQEFVDPLLTHLKDKSGIILVHSQTNSLLSGGREMLISSKIGLQDQVAAISNIRESSINSFFFRIVRNTFTRFPEKWGLVTYFGNPVTPTISIERFSKIYKFLGFNTVVFQNSDLSDKDDLRITIPTSTKSFLIDRSMDGYTIANLNSPASFASIPQVPLTLLIMDNGFKERKITDPVYTRFQEMFLEKELYEKTLPFSSGKLFLEDNIFEIEQSKYIIISSIKYRNIQDALDIFEKYTRQGKIFFILPVQSTDYKDIAPFLTRNKSIFLQASQIPAFPFEKILSYINDKEKVTKSEINITYNRLSPFTLTFFSTSSDLVRLSHLNFSTTSNSVLEYMPIYVRQSHFPAWKAIWNNSGESTTTKTYLASPGYTLFFIKASSQAQQYISASLIFTTPQYVVIAHLISLAALLSLAIAAVLQYKRSS